MTILPLLKRFIRSSLTTLCLISSVSYADTSLTRLEFLTEEYPPYNFTKNGELNGISVDMLIKASEAVNDPLSKSNIRVVPWARGYNRALKDANVVLFAAARTEERENLFKWAGPFAEIRISLIAKKSSKLSVSDPKKITDLVGVIREDAGDQLAKTLGIPENVINRSTTPAKMAKMLASDRIQFWAYSEKPAFSFLSSNGENLKDYEVVYVLQSIPLYYAFNKKTDDALVNKLQKGLDLIKK